MLLRTGRRLSGDGGCDIQRQGHGNGAVRETMLAATSAGFVGTESAIMFAAIALLREVFARELGAAIGVHDVVHAQDRSFTSWHKSPCTAKKQLKTCVTRFARQRRWLILRQKGQFVQNSGSRRGSKA